MSDMLQKLDYSFSGHGQPVAPTHFLSPAMLSLKRFAGVQINIHHRGIIEEGRGDTPQCVILPY